MRSTTLFAALLTVAACGQERDDGDAQQAAATEQAPSLPTGPDFAEFTESQIADSEARPQMQLQVVLDRQGFGPGVIDGTMRRPTRNALKGFQEANGLSPSGELDEATRSALARWADVPATRVVRIPDSWGEVGYVDVPEEIPDQANLEYLGYESLGEKLAERFHTTVEVLQQLNPGGSPAGMQPEGTGAPDDATGVPAYPPRTRVTPTPPATTPPAEGEFRPGQLVRVPNVAAEPIRPGSGSDEWLRTLASLGVGSEQPEARRIVVDKSESWLKAYDDAGKLLATYTVTSGSGHDPLPLGEWGITGVSHNPPFTFDPDLFWDVPDSEAEKRIPPGPNGPVGVVWIDLTKEHYGIHGTPEPQNIGVTQSHGCVRLTNWDAARLAGMVDTSTEVIFQA
jgi:lipoprotein-anchoring transpeptidase ErfK/SrfK